MELNFIETVREQPSRLAIQRVWNSVWRPSTVAVAPDRRSHAVDESASDLAMRSTIDLTRRSALLGRGIEEFMSGEPAWSG